MNNSLNKICSYLLHTKHYTLNLLMAPIVGERELSGISDTACYPLIYHHVLYVVTINIIKTGNLSTGTQLL